LRRGGSLTSLASVDDDASDPTEVLNNNVADTLSRRHPGAGAFLSSGSFSKKDRLRCIKMLDLGNSEDALEELMKIIGQVFPDLAGASSEDGEIARDSARDSLESRYSLVMAGTARFCTRCSQARAAARRLQKNSWVSMFYLSLTIYALLGPDL
ncbi:unnamed protein product, partial [Prorocentrum cordatum]